jgi:L-threonylcarbamoyladenylate synthase
VTVDRTHVLQAVDVLQRGGLVAFPTETVYGLGADASNPDAVGRIFTVKGRPARHPLIVHLADADDLPHWAGTVPATAHRLADALWPGPLTVVVPRSDLVPDVVTGGLDTVGLRVPAQPVALDLLQAFGGGVAAPSANRFGRVSPTSAAHVVADLGADVDFVLDGGPCAVGLESTIVDCSGTEPLVLRLGGVTLQQLHDVLGAPVAVAGPAAAAGRAPGTLASHYAPRCQVVVAGDGDGDAAAAAAAALDAGRRVAVLAGAPVAGLPVGAEPLEPAGDAAAYARCLYARLREADARGVDVLVAVPPPDAGMGAAVTDRLRRAAASTPDR